MSSAPTLLVRADASPQMGTGHLMRCLALAQQWRDCGGKLALATRCKIPPLLERWRSEGAEIHELRSRLQSEGEEVNAIVGAAGAQWIALDGYQFTPRHQAALKSSGARLLMIDDNAHAHRYCADLILDQNLTADAGNYSQRPKTSCLLMGTKYALLRREFRDQARPMRSFAQPRKILVTMGGSDPKNVMRIVLKALAASDLPLEVRAVVGPGFTRRAVTRSAAAKIKFCGNVANMAELLAWADVAISAAGATLWELAYMAVPTLTVELVDHQRPLARAFARAGAGVNLGWYKNLRSGAIVRALSELLCHPERLLRMSAAGRAMVDDRGAARVVQAMMEFPCKP